jgi:glutathione S-transferase
VPIERVTIDLSNPPEWFGRISPLGKVPLLRIRRSDGSEVVLFGVGENSRLGDAVKNVEVAQR